MLKIHETVKCQYQHNLMTKTREKMLQPMQTAFSQK